MLGIGCINFRRVMFVESCVKCKESMVPVNINYLEIIEEK